MPGIEASRAAAIAEMVLSCVHREYPAHVSHLLMSANDARPPRELTPAFYGSFDWHSAVHGHWCLLRLARLHPGAPWRGRALSAVGVSLTRERLAGERRYLEGEGRQGFERPYGLAWLLQLCAEIREWMAVAPANDDDVPELGGWLEGLAPIESLAADRIVSLLEGLPRPVRGGEHSQTAFAVGLTLDWSRVAARDDVRASVSARALDFYRGDRAAPVAYEPSGHDFLSPALGEADLMRRVVDPGAYATWLEAFLPEPSSGMARAWLTPVSSPDRADGKLSHLDGLNLSRAWMLDGINASLSAAHPWRATLETAARAHAEAGLTSVPSEHYAGMHWLGSFAVYLLTRRGLDAGDGIGPGRG